MDSLWSRARGVGPGSVTRGVPGAICAAGRSIPYPETKGEVSAHMVRLDRFTGSR